MIGCFGWRGLFCFLKIDPTCCAEWPLKKKKTSQFSNDFYLNRKQRLQPKKSPLIGRQSGISAKAQIYGALCVGYCWKWSARSNSFIIIHSFIHSLIHHVLIRQHHDRDKGFPIWRWETEAWCSRSSSHSRGVARPGLKSRESWGEKSWGDGRRKQQVPTQGRSFLI